jgi:hypothetical protein
MPGLPNVAPFMEDPMAKCGSRCGSGKKTAPKKKAAK